MGIEFRKIVIEYRVYPSRRKTMGIECRASAIHGQSIPVGEILRSLILQTRSQNRLARF
jgi:hypothetical protein